MAKAQPAAKFKIGYVTATVWLNDKFYNVVVSKYIQGRGRQVAGD